ncbi:MAG: zinc-ribbon domain-containing protein [Promethearchaeota archaeon]
MEMNSFDVKRIGTIFVALSLALVIAVFPAGASAQGGSEDLDPLAQSGDVDVIAIDRPSFIWVRGNITMRLTAYREMTVWLKIANSGNGPLDEVAMQTHLTFGENLLEFPISTVLSALPGQYTYYIIISNASNFSTNTYLSQEFTICVGMGVPFLVLFAAILLMVLAIGLVKGKAGFPVGASPAQVGSQVPSATQSPVQGPSPQQAPAGGAPAPTGQGAPPGKVKCPHCNKLIQEGSVFCPECGERVPAFYRYNPA